jgi:hypothetical protein
MKHRWTKNEIKGVRQYINGIKKKPEQRYIDNEA